MIEELDELKQGSGRVRDTIRWLEVQLRSGNRFLRTQRLDERKELPMIKYPKKKDKETWWVHATTRRDMTLKNFKSIGHAWC